MSFFRRKNESGKAPDDSSGAQSSSGQEKQDDATEARDSASSATQTTESEQSSTDGEREKRDTGAEPAVFRRERHPGSIMAPGDGAAVSGTVEIEASLAEGASHVGARIEWSQDEKDWSRLELSGDDYELIGALPGKSSERIALVRSAELAEARKLLLEQEGYESVEVSPVRPSSWQGRQRLVVGCDTSVLPEGACLLRLVTISAIGEEIAGDPVRWIIDNVGPEIRLREPLAGRSLSGFVTISVEAEDTISGVSVVELELSETGEEWRRLAEAHRQPFELRWSSEALNDGTYRVRIGARDGRGNLSLTEPVEIEIANAPSVAAELVDPGELLRGRVNLIARTPDFRSTQMIFELAKEGSGDWRALGTTRAPFHLPVETDQFADGSYELRIESITAEGRSTHSRRFGPYVIDNTPPTIAIIKPARGETLRGRVELVVEVTDDVSGQGKVELSFSQGKEWITLAELEPVKGEVRGLWQTSGCRPGDCRLRAKASDRAGNEAEEIVELTIAAPASAEPVPEPESISPPKTQEQAASARQPSSSGGRFGQVPSWDWKRRRSAGEREPVVESGSAGGAEAKPPDETKERRRTKTGAAWTWKASPPRSKPEAEQGPEPERASEPGEQAAGAEKEFVRDLSVVEALPEEKNEEAGESQGSGPTDTGPEESERVVSIDFARAARGWDLWQLSELVEDTPGQDPARQEERRQILYHLREHSSVDGRIPPEFEPLIYEAFGELMPGDSSA